MSTANRGEEMGRGASSIVAVGVRDGMQITDYQTRRFSGTDVLGCLRSHSEGLVLVLRNHFSNKWIYGCSIGDEYFGERWYVGRDHMIAGFVVWYLNPALQLNVI
jgi:hypothetical protein